MTDTVIEGFSPLSLLRRPRFAPDDLRSPSQATLHALPAFAFFAINVWLVGLGLVYFIASSLPIPNWFLVSLLVATAVPCAIVSWGLYVQCVEVEATLEM